MADQGVKRIRTRPLGPVSGVPGARPIDSMRYVQPSAQKAYGSAALAPPIAVLATWGLRSAGVDVPDEVGVYMGSLAASLFAWLIRN